MRSTSGNLKESLARHQQSVLIVPDRVEINAIRNRLPAEATLELIAVRGSRRLVEVRVPSAQARSSVARAGKPRLK